MIRHLIHGHSESCFLVRVPSESSRKVTLTVLGTGLATFGAVLATIYYFKSQTVVVSTVFLAVISYVLGEAMSNFIPRKTWLGRFLNPHPVSS